MMVVALIFTRCAKPSIASFHTHLGGFSDVEMMRKGPSERVSSRVVSWRGWGHSLGLRADAAVI